MKLNLVELGRSGSKLVSVAGHVAWQCQEAEAADPVTFTTREAHLVSFFTVINFFYTIGIVQIHSPIIDFNT